MDGTIENGYVSLPVREYQPTDLVSFVLSMEPEKIYPNPLVHQNRNCLAIRRGPFIFALESIDQDERLTDLRLARIDPTAELEIYEPDGFDRHIVGIKAAGFAMILSGGGGPDSSHLDTVSVPVELKFIPYFAWGNRGRSDMRVWIAEQENY